MKSFLKKLLTLISAAALVFVTTACGEDDALPVAPTVDVPATQTVDEGSTTVLEFEVNTPGGFAFADRGVVIGGTATITDTPEDGATEGTVEITFIADGVGLDQTIEAAIQIEVSDNSGQTGQGVATLNVQSTDVPPVPVETVRENITSNTTWTADKIWVLDTRVTVESGATLTIEPGTVIKGNTGAGAASTALLIARGAQLNAQGTAALPIIFTAINDPITPRDIAAGNYASTTSPTDIGRWGGLIILGNAPISAQNNNDQDITEVQIEGIPATDTNGLYGGNDPTDNSGTISYISIRHGGTNIGAGNEINGLTLGGVGSGTTISNVEVVANADDGIEFFGGNVSIDGVVIWNSNDDSMDTDQDWVGTVSNFIIITPIGGSAFELDGPEGNTSRGVDHVFTEGVVYGGDAIDAIVDWDGNTNAELTNIYFFGITAGRVDSFGGVNPSSTTNWETDLADNAAGYFDGVSTGVVTYGVAAGAKTYGPTAADFAWTWAGNSGALAGIGL